MLQQWLFNSDNYIYNALNQEHDEEAQGNADLEQLSFDIACIEDEDATVDTTSSKHNTRKDGASTTYLQTKKCARIEVYEHEKDCEHCREASTRRTPQSC